MQRTTAAAHYGSIELSADQLPGLWRDSDSSHLELLWLKRQVLPVFDITDLVFGLQDGLCDWQVRLLAAVFQRAGSEFGN